MKQSNFVLAMLLGAILFGSNIATGQEAHSGAMVNPNMRVPLGPRLKNAAEMTAVANASNGFAFDLYGKLRSADGGNDNLFFSPYSLSSALTMTRLGASGATADEMSATLHLPADVPAIENGFQSLNRSLTGHEQPSAYTLDIANAVWGQRGQPFLPDYLDVVKTDFDADLTPMDFSGQADACRVQINEWVAKKTQDKIKDLLLPGTITPQTMLVLTNAVYFKGKWSDPFDADQTAPGDFKLFAGQSAKADMMHDKGEYAYAEDDLCQMVRLPYAGDQLVMLVFLPKLAHPTEADRAADPLRRALENFEASLNDAYVQKLAGQAAERRINLALPKWHATQAFDLGQTLSGMGMKLAFTPDADFSGTTGQKGLYLSDVVHKAFVAVDEQGTEAAAGSGAVAPGGFVAPQPPIDFTADHPFVYMIVHQPSHTILFAGRMCDPAGK